MKNYKVNKSGAVMAAVALCASLSLSSCAQLISTSAQQNKKSATSTSVATSSSTSQSTSSTTVGQAKADGSTSKGRSSVAK